MMWDIIKSKFSLTRVCRAMSSYFGLTQVANGELPKLYSLPSDFSKTRLTGVLNMPGERYIRVKPYIKVTDCFSWRKEISKDDDMENCVAYFLDTSHGKV